MWIYRAKKTTTTVFVLKKHFILCVSFHCFISTAITVYWKVKTTNYDHIDCSVYVGNSCESETVNVQKKKTSWFHRIKWMEKKVCDFLSFPFILNSGNWNMKWKEQKNETKLQEKSSGLIWNINKLSTKQKSKLKIKNSEVSAFPSFHSNTLKIGRFDTNKNIARIFRKKINSSSSYRPSIMNGNGWLTDSFLYYFVSILRFFRRILFPTLCFININEQP